VSSRHGSNTTRSADRVPHHALNLAILVRGATGHDGDMTIPGPGLTVPRVRGEGWWRGRRVELGGMPGLGPSNGVARSHPLYSERRVRYPVPRLDRATIGMGRQTPNEIIQRAED
jgi:hypothetical protein